MTGLGGGTIHADLIRVTRLGTGGAALVGANSLYTSSALTTTGWTEQNSDDEEIEVRNASGQVCVYYKSPGALKSLEAKLTICTPDPELNEIIRGGTVLTTSGVSRGWAAPRVGTQAQPNGVSLEVWSKRIINGSQANDFPWWRWVLPRGRFKADERTLANEAGLGSFTGVFEENDGWDDGPLGDWPYTSESLYQYAAMPADDIPDAVLGYQAVSA